MTSMLDEGELVEWWHCAIGMHGCMVAATLIRVSSD
jgi:hypothetical protein